MTEPVLVEYSNGKVPDTMSSEKPDQNGAEVPGAARYEIENGETVEVKIKDGSNSSEAGKDGDEKKKEEPPPMVGFFQLFRFSTCLDIVLMIIGGIAALIHGSAMPLMIIVFGDTIDSFVSDAKFSDIFKSLDQQFNLTTVHNITEGMALNNFTVLSALFKSLNLTVDVNSLVMNIAQEDLLPQMTRHAIYFTAIGAGVLLMGYIQSTCWITAAERQGYFTRMLFYRKVLHQEIGWFDVHEAGELNTRMSDDMNKIQDGIGEKMGFFIQWFTAFIAGFVVGFIYGWKLTLVILAVSPLLALSGGIMSQLGSSFTTKELKAYAKAGAVAEEVIGSMRTVAAFSGESKECARYNGNLDEARQFGVKKALISGLGMGLVFFLMFCIYALAFWYGAKLTRDEPENYTIGRMLIVFFSVLIGAFSIGNAAPHLQTFATARGAAYFIFQIIDNKPSIDSSSEEGIKPADVKGNIKFTDVQFAYPSRPDVQVLDRLNLEVNVGQTVALVGSSGCGKSTTVQLIQRFYDVASGQISLDGCDIRSLNIKWLREHLGVVSQEPVLFGLTISENIRYGRLDVTHDEIITAAKEANAHDFIMKLPDKYETLVGERGAQLSGGQKQRIAITRALVRNPKILLLDEATSALDTESESTVQAALDKARMGRTTIVIAHRLSTIQTADVIVGFDKGKAVEAGTHEELMQKEGIYYKLVTSQTQAPDEDEEEVEELAIDDETPEGKAGSDRKPTSGLLKKRGYFAVGTSESELKRHDSQRISLKRHQSTPSKPGLQRSMSAVSKTKEEEKEEELPDPPLGRIMKMNAPEWFFILLGCFGALINGGIQPAFAMIFADIIGVFAKPLAEQEALIILYSCMFIVVAVAALLAMFIQSYMFGISGEKLTERMRQMYFSSLMKQDISYFDDHRNNTGAVCTRLATEASAVQGATGARLGTVVQSMVSIIIALVIGFIYSWHMTLLILGFVPVLIIAGILQMDQFTNKSNDNQEALEKAGKVAIESIENMRTVASLTREEKFVEEYRKQLSVPHSKSMKKAHLQGFGYGFSQGVIFFAYAAAFILGAYLIEQKILDFTNMFRVFGVMIFSAMSLGNANSFAPDYGKAKKAAAKMFQLFDREPLIDSSDPDGAKPAKFEGLVEFRDVHFNYPTRPDVPILQGLNVCVNPGQRLALVGSSGCGKSTTIQLLERFYDPKEGHVLLDGTSTKDLNIQWMRSQMGIVSQEPVLFDKTIAENIAYGDTSREASMDEIIEAARGANIHNFISTLPSGYDTNVGDRGTQLSGGQKQRVAIARALLRNPKILLLDEATSALDTESEKIVQEALDRAQEGRTSIVIAHRLSTIQNADSIAVIRHGHVVEQGTHIELMARQGFYYKLNSKLKQ